MCMGTGVWAAPTITTQASPSSGLRPEDPVLQLQRLWHREGEGNGGKTSLPVLLKGAESPGEARPALLTRSAVLIYATNL